MTSIFRATALVFAIVSVAAIQVPVGGGDSRVNYPFGETVDPKTLAPPGSGFLSTLSSDDFTTFYHPSKPSHRLRIKKSPKAFCDPTVNSYTGYLDVAYNTKHLFFYFFESRSDPANDDVLMWINGGPGCSSSVGLFMELGPCSVENPLAPGLNATKWNPHSWNADKNLFFLDQPVGVGFSYADYDLSVGTTEDAAKDVEAFVTLFFETFSQFKGRPFHMSGESYAGRYLPLFASAIYDSNSRAKSENRTPINLKSVLIGNGLTAQSLMYSGYIDMACSSASIPPLPPVLDIQTCVAAKQALPRCEKWMKEECLDRYDAIGCQAASEFCSTIAFVPIAESGKNPYDLSKDCEGDFEESLCYPETKRIATFLDQAHIRKILGADHSTGNYTTCSDAVGQSFQDNGDLLHESYLWVAQLLERGIEVLIYVGTYDWICNHIGNYAWVQTLEWSGTEAFLKEDLVDWKVDGKVAGQVKSAKGLTYATVFGAGHMVPYDKPAESLAMLQRFLARERLHADF